MSIIENSVTRTNFPSISSPEDAQLIAAFIQFNLTDKIRDALRSDLTVASSQIAFIEAIGQLGIQVQKSTSGPYSEITPEKIAANKTNSAALKSIFLNDSPKLGENLSEANETVRALQGAGFLIVAPQEVPVLIEVYNKDNKFVSSNFSWINQDLRASLNSLNKINPTYPGSVSFQANIPTGSTLRVIVFDEFANLRPTQAAAEKTKTELVIKLNTLVTDFSKVLAQSISTSNRLDVRTSGILENNKQEINKINSLNLQRFEQFSEILKSLRLRVLEDEKKLKINEEKIPDVPGLDQGIITVLKIASSRVEGSLPNLSPEKLRKKILSN